MSRRTGGNVRRPWPTAPKEHVYTNTYKHKTQCECDRPNVWKDTGNCAKCGHAYDPWAALQRTMTKEQS